jgi:hypothetical protein
MEVYMGIVVVYESSNAILWYHPESNIVHHKIYNFSLNEEFISFINLASRTLAEKKSAKWLSEDQSLFLMEKGSSDFRGVSWPKKTIEAGWKYWAIVQPKNIITQINMEKIVKHFKTLGVTARFYSEVDEAMQWLESL